jgi:site-specific DNA-methyltransferase (adenine-specific)
VQLIHGDCLEKMKDIESKSIDMILCDLPYGTTACKWDTIIPFEPLWEQYERVIKDNGAIVLTASQPFTSNLVMSNPKMFKYEWIWNKTRPTGSMLAKKRPLKEHECVLVFYKKQPTYNPQMTKAERVLEKERIVNKGEVTGNVRLKRKFDNGGLAYPRSIQLFANPNHNSLHPTQKPVALLEYLIKTYTLEGETVLDNCMGSGSTGVACINTNRNFIGIEKDDKYFEIAKKRIEEHLTTAST